MADASIGTPEQLRDPNYTPPIAKAIPLGIQHVLAMFVSNVTPAIIVCGAAGFGFGSNSPDFPQMIYMIQMSMFFAGIATLFQTVGIGPVGKTSSPNSALIRLDLPTPNGPTNASKNGWSLWKTASRACSMTA